MLDSKLSKIKDLIEQKQRIDDELAVLLGEKDKPKRGRKPRGTVEEAHQTEE